MLLIHIHRRLVALRLADDTRRYAESGETGCNTDWRAPIFAPRPSILPRTSPGAQSRLRDFSAMTVAAAGFTGPAEVDCKQNVIYQSPPFRRPMPVRSADPAADFAAGGYPPGTVYLILQEIASASSPHTTASGRYGACKAWKPR